MRFLHTADWHIGRSFFNLSLIEDQFYVLEQLIKIAQEGKADLLLIAGDIYDRAFPPVEAIKLLDDVLCRLILDVKIPIIIIGGNHDSPSRLEFASRLMETHRLFVFGSISNLHVVDMFDEWGRITFYPLPYSEPSHSVEHFRDSEITNHEKALRKWLHFFQENHPPESRSVLIHHCYVAGSYSSESERPLDIGGADMVSIDCFNQFHYAALGHLHRPQILGAKSNIHYPGSILKYSFSEASQIKGVNLVEIDGKGNCKVESIPLLPKRDVRCLEGTMDDLLHSKFEQGNYSDYIQVRLLDEGAVYDAMDRLREIYPYLVSIDHLRRMPIIRNLDRIDHRKRELINLFSDFYKYVTGDELDDEQKELFMKIANCIRENERSL